MRRSVLAEQGVRILAIALYAVPLGLLIAWISPGWLNRDAVPPGWMLTCLGALGAVLVLGTLVALPPPAWWRRRGTTRAMRRCSATNNPTRPRRL